MKYKDQHIYFSTITIRNWISIFHDFPETNYIILQGFHHFVKEPGNKIYAFVIMRDHIHVVWQFGDLNAIQKNINTFKKYSGRSIVDYLYSLKSEYLEYFVSGRKDRKHHVWKRSEGRLHITGPKIMKQKINYIHNNPTKENYRSVEEVEDYLFSSARAYSVETSNFSFLTLAKGL